MRRTSQLTLIDSEESSTSLCGILKTLLFSVILVDEIPDPSTEIVPRLGMDVTGQPSSEAKRLECIQTRPAIFPGRCVVGHILFDYLLLLYVGSDGGYGCCVTHRIRCPCRCTCWEGMSHIVLPSPPYHCCAHPRSILYHL